MEYLVTFDDGDSAFLSHYGVSGMKWGKWNPETQAKYARASNGTYYKKAQRGSEYGKAVTNKRREYNALQPKGKQIAKNVLLSPWGAHAYNTGRSRGFSRAEALSNASWGPIYAQGVKMKQENLGTTKVALSKAAKKRIAYEKGQSSKKNLVKAFGGLYSVNYNSIRAENKGRGKAILGTVLTAAAASASTSNPALAPLAYAPKAYSYYRNDLSPHFKNKNR